MQILGIFAFILGVFVKKSSALSVFATILSTIFLTYGETSLTAAHTTGIQAAIPHPKASSHLVGSLDSEIAAYFVASASPWVPYCKTFFTSFDHTGILLAPLAISQASAVGITDCTRSAAVLVHW